MKTIQVLMSTYNGKKYIQEQIDSILAQDCEEKGIAKLCIRIRDDGSTDGTQELLEDYAKKYPQYIQWEQGKNVGVIKSFFELLQKAEDSDYYAFSDQDDYWMPEKLSRGIEKIEEMQTGRPFLYCCRPKLVDVELQPISSEIYRPPMRPSFQNAMIENIVTGCTAVFNKKLKILVTKEFPDFTVMHDWWLYLAATAFGDVYYDEESYICYRQHGGNVLGTKTKRIDEIKMRLKRYRSTRGNISRQLLELLRIYEKEYPQNQQLRMAREIVEAKKSFRKRMQVLRLVQPYRQRKNDDRIFHIILLIGSY